jgi:DNA-directed RNA polymerase subunit RPC12/RpoP
MSDTNDNLGISCELPAPSLLWEYKCNDCQATFETPVPRGPKEERHLKCPVCDSAKIKRINIVKLEAAKCGG